MDVNNPVVKLCIEGSRAEFEGRREDAHALYLQAWGARQDEFDACIAAHYVARFQQTPANKLHWNQTALTCAQAVGDDRVQAFYPSLYLNMGQSYELIGEIDEAKHYYDLAAELGYAHQAERLR